MKYILFMLLMPLSPSVFGFECFKSQEKRNQERAEQKAKRMALIYALNHSGQDTFEVSLKTKDELFSTYTLPSDWPQIRKTLAYDEQDTMEWTVQIQQDSCAVEIVGPIITSTTSWKNNNENYNWAIRPLALGHALIKARYIHKDTTKIKDEIIYKVTVTD